TMGDRIKERRKTLKINQQDLSEKTGLAQSQISRYETDDNEPTGEILLLLAEALDTTTDWLLGRSNAVKKNSSLDEEERELIELLGSTDGQMGHRIINAIKAFLE